MSKSEEIISRIIGIQLSMASPKDVLNNSVAEIVSRDTYINGKPVVGGLFDPRMGPIDSGLICPTDRLTHIDTPGYFGHVHLARPVFYIQHIKEIKNVCKCFCYKCSKILVNKNNHKHILSWSGEEKYDYVKKITSKIKRCGNDNMDGCGCKQPDSIKIEGFSSIYGEWTGVETQEDKTKVNIKMKFTPEIILKIFKRISDEDVSFMGMNPLWSRPEWMVCEILPIAPPSVRPSVKHDAQQRSEDDLTHIYSNIIKTNNDLQNKLRENSNQHAIDSLTTILQYFVAMIVNNKAKGVVPLSQRSGRPLQCIMGRLNSKNGRIRGNLMGKRVDYSARSVITGDPNLSITQLGVPLKIAKNITKPMVVNDRNRNFLLKLIDNGPDVYPGAKILERKNGESISLRYIDRASIYLENGDIVHRHMMDGDAVLFNRQPSLHRMSMMCHIVKIMEQGDTFRINVGVTKPYNADFDGDEMNMHMPQNILAETELRHLAAIPYQIISPGGNSPIIGIFQDGLLGSYRFTRPNIHFTPLQAMNLLMKCHTIDTSIFQSKKITNFEIISQIMPPLTLKYKTKLYNDNKPPEANTNHILEIMNGQYLRGQMEKSVLSSGTKGIIHRICNDFGNMAATKFIDDLQNIITEYMKTSSYSVGIKDLIADKTTYMKIMQSINQKKLEVQSVIDHIHLGTFQNDTANTNIVEFETRVNNILNKATEESGKIGRDSLDENNRFVMIVNSGSKGSLLNISQMISCLGQQNVDAKRIPYGFDNRTLPHYSKYDDSPNARGFIESSYISGLKAEELFFHAMGGRIGLIDTACKTATTGYIQRRLIKGLEDIKIEYDGTVRDSKGKIVQFAYGEDGFDPMFVENQSIPLVSMTIEDIYLHFDIPGLFEKDSLLEIYTKGTSNRIKKQKEETQKKFHQYIDYMIHSRDKIVNSIFRYKNENGIKMPVAFQNIINNIQGQLNLNANTSVDITPLEAFDMIEQYMDKIKTIYYVPPTELFQIMYYYYLSPKELLSVKRFHHKALILLLETIVLKYKQAIAHPGEMVGVVAGQSIGEPATQLTLNTFHSSGVSSKSNVTRGVPRIEEILRLTQNPKNPSLTIFMKPLDELEQEKATKYANMIEHTKLGDVIQSIQICFDPNDSTTLFEEDGILLKRFHQFEDMILECSGGGEEGGFHENRNQSKWIIRMEIDKEMLLDKNITMDDIHFAIKNSEYGNSIHCIYSDYNMDKLIFRIRANGVLIAAKKKKSGNTLDQSDDIYILKNLQDSLMNDIILRGVTNITNVTPRKLQNMLVKEDGAYKKKDLWVLDTTGTNLLDAMALDFIDYKRTYSNDIKEVFEVLGIEAARQIIYNELVEVMEFSDIYINYHHLSVLCDRMTLTKNLVSIYRTGILNDDIGPIAKATFEVHTEVLLNAARHGELDHMRGVSANIMCGQYGHYGTNSFKMVLDLKQIEEQMDDVDVNTVNVHTAIEQSFGFIEQEKSDLCSKGTIEIQNNISTIPYSSEIGVCNDDYEFGL
jgi:DNA-directed RNA polymerase II subunit RPB1